MRRPVLIAMMFVSACSDVSSSTSSRGVIAPTAYASARAALEALEQKYSDLSQRTLGPAPVEVAVDGWATPAPALARGQARAFFPATASAPFRVESSHAAISVRLAKLDSGSGVAVDNQVVYAAKLDSGDTTYIQRPSEAGTQDLLILNEAPPRSRVEYEVRTLRGIAGLRLVDRTLEFVDALGTPQLRMARVAIQGADGRLIEPVVDVQGCVVDTSPRAPWGRGVAAPGSDVCTVSLDWAGQAVTYPALFDPSWEATGAMISPGRKEFGLSTLNDGRLLASGGSTSTGVLSSNSGSYFPTAELFDPATSTWAATGALGWRARHTQTTLLNGVVLVTGGGRPANSGTPNAQTLLYDPTTGAWTTGPGMNAARMYHTATLLDDGRVLVTGGGWGTSALPSAETYDPVANSFTTRPAMAVARHTHSAVKLYDGRVLVAGGYTGSAYTGSAQLYNPVTNTWTTTGSLSTPRAWFTLSMLEFGMVLAVGGNGAAGTLSSAELFSLDTGRFTATAPSLPAARAGHAAVARGDRVFVTGGSATPNIGTTTTYVYDAGSNVWRSGPALAAARLGHATVVLRDLSVMSVGSGGAERLRSSQSTYNAERAPKLPVSIDWVTTTGTLGVNDNLFYTITNNTNADLPVTVRVLARGLDERESVRTYGPFTVGTIPQTKSLRVGDLPVQSTGTPSQVELIAVVPKGTGTVEVPSLPQHYEFSSTFSSATFYGEKRKKIPSVDDPRLLFGVTNGEVVVSNSAMQTVLKNAADPIFSHTGQVWNQGDQRFQPWTELLPIGGAGGTVVGMVPLGPLTSNIAENAVVQLPPSAEGTPTLSYTVCAKWTGRFIDSGFGETYGQIGQDDTSPAVYNLASITRRSDGSLVWQGNLDSSGCKSIQLKSNTQYVMTMFPKATRPDNFQLSSFYRRVQYPALANDDFHYQNEIDAAFAVKYTPSGATSVSYTDNLALAIGFRTSVVGGTVNLRPRYNDALTRSLVTTSRVLADTEALVPTFDRVAVLAMQLCPDAEAGTSCVANGWYDLYLGWTANNLDSRYKFIIGHEFGHSLQHLAVGSFSKGYTSLGEPAGNVLCHCQDLLENNQHCLNSREPSASAQSEAFGHFIATRTWNDLSQGCKFVYYKPSYPETGAPQREPPPAGRSCSVANAPYTGQWEQNRCGPVQSGKGVEWDWLNFYTSLSTGPSAFTMTKLYAVYTGTCGGECKDTSDVTWSNLVGHVNPTDLSKWNAEGAAAGVNH